MVARFHGGHLDGQLIADWPDPPGRAVWVERVDGGVVVTDDPAAAQAADPTTTRRDMTDTPSPRWSPIWRCTTSPSRPDRRRARTGTLCA